MKDLLNLLAVLLVLTVFVSGLYVRLSNPDMTDLRLMLVYWRTFMLHGMMLIMACYCFYKGGKHGNTV